MTRWLVVGGCWVVLAASLAHIQPWSVDDAYIVYRYAENWVAGFGPVFNPGEWVEGYSSPVWLVVLTLAHALGADTPTAAKVMGVGLVAAVPVVLVLAPRTAPLTPAAAGWAAAIAGTSGPLLAWSGGGLDAPAAAAIALVAWLGHAGDRWWGPAAAVVAPLVRPELLLVPLLQVADRLAARRWREVGVLVAALVLVLGVHEALRLYLYGEWLPNPFYAKVGSTTDQILRGLRYSRRWLPSCGVAVLVGLGAVRHRPFAAMVAWVLGHIAFVVAVGGDGLPAFRFFVPIAPVAGLAAALAVQGTAGHVVGAVVVAWQLAAAIFDPRLAPRYDKAMLEERGREVGSWLRDHFPADTVIATNTAGTVPYYSGLVSVDMLGLCDRHIAHAPVELGAGRAGHEKADGAYVLSREPDLVMLGAAPGTREGAFRSDRQLLRHPAFRLDYKREFYRLPSGRIAVLYRRRGSPGPTDQGARRGPEAR